MTQPLQLLCPDVFGFWDVFVTSQQHCGLVDSAGGYQREGFRLESGSDVEPGYSVGFLPQS